MHTHRLLFFNFYKFMSSWKVFICIYTTECHHTCDRVNDALGFNLGFNIDFLVSLIFSLNPLHQEIVLALTSEYIGNQILHYRHFHTHSMSHLDYANSFQANLFSSALIPLKYVYIDLAAKLILKSYFSSQNPPKAPLLVKAIDLTGACQSPMCWLHITVICLLLQSSLLIPTPHRPYLWSSHTSRTLQPQNLCSNCLLCPEYFPKALRVPNSLTFLVLAQMPSL